MIRPVPGVAALASYPLASLDDPTAISLAQNESAFPPSPKAISAGQTCLVDHAAYPDPDWRDLRTAIAEVHGVAAQHIICGAGSMELIDALIRAFSGPGDEVLGTQYGYLFVGTAAAQAGATYRAAPETDLRVDVDAILASLRPATRIVFVCNPGNPTGTRIQNAEIVRLREALPGDVLLGVDQAYAEFDDQKHKVIFDLVARGDTVVTRTFSKAYGLAGARVGWCLAPPEIGVEMRKLLNPNNVTLAAQAMATAAMRDQDYMRARVTKTAELRDRTRARLLAAGYALPESATNFLLIRFRNVAMAEVADKALRAAGLITRGMDGYGLPDCLRATIGPEGAMARMVEVLEGLA